MGSGQSLSADVEVDPGRLLASLRERWIRIIAASISVAVATFILASLSSPSYRAETRILIEGESSAAQAEVIGSIDILTKVAGELDLVRREEFKLDDLSTFGRLMVMAGLRTDPGSLAPADRVLRKLHENLDIRPVTDSVVAIGFSSHDPELAAKTPNAIAEAYLEVRRQASISAADRLKSEIAQLREDVHAADVDVADFRAKSGPPATQRLAEVSGELSQVKAAQAKAETIRAALQGGAAMESLPSVLASGLIQRLRERQMELRSQIADLSTTLLPNHPRIRTLNAQLVDLDEQIHAEAQNVLEGIETGAETARLREQELVSELNRLKVKAVRADEQQVELRALQREADSKRQLLESYLIRYNKAVSTGADAYSPPDARVISRAMTPSAPYSPRIILITAAAFAATLVLMTIVTLLAELFSGRNMHRAWRPVAAIPQVVMPAVPVLPDEEAAMAEEGGTHEEPRRHHVHDLSRAAPEDAVQHGIEGAARKLIEDGAHHAVFVSPEHVAGAASSVLVARMVADSGLRVILVDLTTSGTASVPMLETTAFPGITNLLASEAQFCDVIRGDLYSDCHIIPVGTASGARAMRAGDRLPIIADSLASAYDLVIIECGHATADALARVVGADSVIMVSALDSDGKEATGMVKEFAAAGLGAAVLVTPAGSMPPVAARGRDAA